MADHDDDLEVSRRYRELGPEEPPPALDARILAEARRAAQTRPAPLVPPTGRRRWYFPVAAAAVIVLAVAVTAQIEREQRPDAEALPPSAPPVETKKESAAPPAAPPKLAPRRPAAQPAEPQPGPAAPAAEMADKRAADAAAAGAPAAAARAPMQASNLAKVQSPEAELERIAQLRRDGKDDEADAALKEFRRRYPDFKIPEEMLRRVERR